MEYSNWINDVSKRFRQSQLKAAVNVNSEMLRFYWELGRDIAEMSKEAGYGSDFYNSVSSDLKDLFPDIKSFSTTNLKYMRYFYEMYPSVPENRQQLVDESGDIKNRGYRDHKGLLMICSYFCEGILVIIYYIEFKVYFGGCYKAKITTKL